MPEQPSTEKGDREWRSGIALYIAIAPRAIHSKFVELRLLELPVIRATSYLSYQLQEWDAPAFSLYP
ncbi:MAG: hypothetical protein F6J93_25845 [Oscillatoria sp. SIO1A7]|nr:hypothetical protein [Oscillatoria sp. SIO1A7]